MPGLAMAKAVCENTYQLINQYQILSQKDNTAAFKTPYCQRSAFTLFLVKLKACQRIPTGMIYQLHLTAIECHY